MYVVGVTGQEAVFVEAPTWRVAVATHRGRPPTRQYVADDTPQPQTVKQFAAQLPRTPLSWRTAPKAHCTPNSPGGGCGRRTTGNTGGPP